MDYVFQFPQRAKTTRTSSLGFAYSKGFSCRNPSPSGVLEVNSVGQWKAYFDATTVNNRLLVIEFTAAWCGPCRLMEPAMNEFAAKYTDVDFIKISVDKLAFVARQFRAETLPAFVLVKGGREVDRVAGVKKTELQNKIEIQRFN